MKNLLSLSDETNDAAERTLSKIVLQLPALPQVIRYDDDYAGIVRSIRDAGDALDWVIMVDGRVVKITWSEIPPSVEAFARSWLAWLISTADASSIYGYLYILRQEAEQLPNLLKEFIRSPELARSYWVSAVVPWAKKPQTLSWCKLLIRYMCEANIGQWTPSHRTYISQWTYGAMGRKDNLAVVRSGDAFLSSAEETVLVDFFDDLNVRAQRTESSSISNDELRAASLLYWAYQHAFRPIQIASLNLTDVLVRDVPNEPPIVHATFYRAKQRSAQAREPMRRSVKRDWSWMMALYVRRRVNSPDAFVTEDDRPHSLFGLPPMGVSRAIQSLNFKLTGTSRTPTAFRHTAAQRLVDSGASQVELAEFLGHSAIDTGLVYFDTSPTQADRVNKALGLSPIYNAVAEVARTKRIDIDALLGLPQDQQIGAAPHGILIAGIGGCDVGQPLCAKNPALSCYTCSKFMPLSDTSVHEDVLDDLRPVVHQFVEAGRGDESNPAFMQLRRTLDALELLISELKEISS